MRTIGARRLEFSFLLVSFIALLRIPQLAFAADQAAVKTTNKPTKSKPAAAAPAAIAEDAALASFDAFTIEWMQKLAQTEDFQRTERVKITESAEGFSAEYIGYLPHRYITVKKTSSKDTPFVGILTYFEKTLRCTGKTREEAVRGPFQQVDTSQVAEIFRFTKGKWKY